MRVGSVITALALGTAMLVSCGGYEKTNLADLAGGQTVTFSMALNGGTTVSNTNGWVKVGGSSQSSIIDPGKNCISSVDQHCLKVGQKWKFTNLCVANDWVFHISQVEYNNSDCNPLISSGVALGIYPNISCQWDPGIASTA